MSEPAPQLGKVVVCFSQDSDTEQAGDIGQDIEITCWDAVEGGHFLTLKTERWAIEDTRDMAALLSRVQKMLKAGAP